MRAPVPPAMSPRIPRLLLVLPLVAAVALAACDSGDDNDTTLADVAGTYDVEAFRFVPDIGALASANVLDTLVAATTSLRIRNSGDVTFEYQFRGGQERAIDGEAEVRGDEVRIRFDDDTATQRGRLLLPQSVVFDIDGDELSALIEDTRADLEAFDPDFYGDTGENDNEPGTLTIRLSRRAATGS